jgi:hypothetical protein
MQGVLLCVPVYYWFLPPMAGQYSMIFIANVSLRCMTTLDKRWACKTFETCSYVCLFVCLFVCCWVFFCFFFYLENIQCILIWTADYFPRLDALILTTCCSVYLTWTHWFGLSIFAFEMRLTAGATGQHGMLDLPRHLIPTLVYLCLGVRVSPFIYLTCNPYYMFRDLLLVGIIAILILTTGLTVYRTWK